MPIQNFYQLIAEHCNSNQIQAVLRKYKQEVPKEIKTQVKIGGNKSELIQRLQNCVEKTIIPAEAAYALLRDAEENGDQHIFYFRARHPQHYADGESVAKALWGAQWQRETNFPQFPANPNKWVWVDFRTNGGDGTPENWIGKLYTVEKRYRLLDERKEAGDIIIRRFQATEQRIVAIVRWNAPDLLEIRISRADNDSFQTMERRMKQIWSMVRDALHQPDFPPWPLDKARFRLLKEERQNFSTYQVGNTSLVDSSSGAATFVPQTDFEDLFATRERQQAVDVYLDSGRPCRMLVVVLKPKAASGMLDDDLRVIMGGHNSHEVIIQSRTRSQSLDYATNKFREFNR